MTRHDERHLAMIRAEVIDAYDRMEAASDPKVGGDIARWAIAYLRGLFDAHDRLKREALDIVVDRARDELGQGVVSRTQALSH